MGEGGCERETSKEEVACARRQARTRTITAEYTPVSKLGRRSLVHGTPLGFSGGVQLPEHLMQVILFLATTVGVAVLGGAEAFAARGQVRAAPRLSSARIPPRSAKQGEAEEMNPEDVARFPLPGTASPISLSFSPDDNILSYLHAEGGQLTRQVRGDATIYLSTIYPAAECVAPLGSASSDFPFPFSLFVAVAAA